jgi:hypothetical protein
VLRRWLALSVLGFGLAVAALAICSATLWRPPDHVSASHKVGSGTALLVAEPGVMEAEADSVEISIEASSPLLAAIGRDTDVTAWVGDSPAEYLTGFRSRHSFLVRETGSVEPPADPAGSDLWIDSWEFTASGAFNWKRAEEGRWSLLLAPLGDSEGDPAVLTGTTITMTWPQVVTTPWLWPGVVVGVLAVAVGLMLALSAVKGQRRSRPAKEESATGQADMMPDAVEPAKELIPVGVSAGGAAPEPGLVAVAAPGGAESSTDQAGQLAQGEAACGPTAMAAETDVVPTATSAGPAQPKRRWFQRRPAVVEAPEPAGPPPPSDLPKIDLSLATPHRNWEPLAAPDPLYADLDLDEELAPLGEVGPLAYEHTPVPFSDARSWENPGRVEADAAPVPYAPPSTPPSSPPTPSPPVSSPPAPPPVSSPSTLPPSSTVTSPPSSSPTSPPSSLPTAVRAPAPRLVGAPAPPAPVTPSAMTARTPGLGSAGAGSAGSGAGERPKVWSDRSRPVDLVPSGPTITPAQKIAALKETHTSVADEAAATIAAAVAAAAGSRSAEGLTRRQIREAERAAAEALHVTGHQTGEVQPWSGASPAPRSWVQMQSGEGRAL